MRNSFITIFTALFIIFSTASASLFAGGSAEESDRNIRKERKTETGEELSVFVSIPPQKFFVEEIGGEYVDVQVLVTQGQSPHTYEPTTAQVMALGGADILFTIGADFEHAFVPKIRSNLPDLIISETNHGIEYRHVELHHHEDDSNEGEDESDRHLHDGEEGNDPHVWMSLNNGKVIAGNIIEALKSQAPEYAGYFEDNYTRLISRIDTLAGELEEIMEPLTGMTFLVFHPSFGYFADEYGLVQESIETGGKEPSAKKVQEIIEEALDDDVSVIFVQPQFNRKSAEVIAAAIDGTVETIDPLAEDWLGNMKKIADTVRKGIGRRE